MAPVAELINTSIAFKQLATDALAELCSCLSDRDFEKLEYPLPLGCQRLSVTFEEYQIKNIQRELKYAARALARECRQLEFTGFAVPTFPGVVENGEIQTANNISLRVCRERDQIRGKMLVHLEVIGVCSLPEVESKSFT
jgi:hypothetical protein